MWNTAPLIFEDEDEEKLLADFVKYSAIHKDRDPFEIAAYVFRNQRDPELRAQQAAMIWAKDIDVAERIRLARLNGGAEGSVIPTKEQRMRQLQEMFEDVTLPVKERIAAQRLLSEMAGDIVKAVDKNVTTGKRQPRQVIYAKYDD